MAFKSPQQPFCRYCGKGIGKETHTHYFGHSFRETQSLNSDWATYHEAEAKTKAEAQRQLNTPVVAIRQGYGGNVVAFTWDGESWKDGLFCSQACAAGFGRFAIAHPAYHTQAYCDAMLAAGRRF